MRTRFQYPILLAVLPLLSQRGSTQGAAEAAAIALADRAETEGYGVVPELIELLDHRDGAVRWHAARGIGLARAAWCDERLARLLDDERVAPMAALAIGQVIGRDRRWPPLDRADELVAAAKQWWKEQSAEGEGWITHDVALSADRRTVVLGQMHAERGTAYLVVRDAAVDRESFRGPGPGPIRALAFSGDSQRFAISDNSGNVLVYTVDGVELVKKLGGHKGWMWSVALSHDGALVASSAQDKMFRVRDVASGEVRFEREDSEMLDAAFLPDGRGLIGAERSGRLLKFGLDGSTTVLAEGLPFVARVAISPDGRRVAALHRDGRLAAFDVEGEGELWSVPAHAARPNDVCWSPDGRWLATAGSDRRVCTWAVEDGTMQREFACDRNVIALRCMAEGLQGAHYDGSAWHRAFD